MKFVKTANTKKSYKEIIKKLITKNRFLKIHNCIIIYKIKNFRIKSVISNSLVFSLIMIKHCKVFKLVNNKTMLIMKETHY